MGSAMVRMMVRGGFTSKGSTMMAWKYADIRCVCGDVESKKACVGL